MSSPKDIIIERLKEELKECRNKLHNSNYEHMEQTIANLKKLLDEKEKEIKDLQAVMNVNEKKDSSMDQDMINTLKTKLIISQSKVRKANEEITVLNEKIKKLEEKLAQKHVNAVSIEEIKQLRLKLRQEMETTDRLRNQLNRLSMQQRNSQSQEYIAQLEQQLQQAMYQIEQLQQNSGSVINDTVQNEIAIRDARIAELEEQLVALQNNTNSPIGNIMLRREISALKAQVDMLKKNEAEMRRKYEQAIRKQEFSWDDGW